MRKIPKELEIAMKTGLPADRAKAVDAIAACLLAELALISKPRKPIAERLRFRPAH